MGALDLMKPKIWSADIIEALKRKLIYGNLATREYEGEAKIGGTVQINEIGEIAVNDYTAYSDMTFQTLDGADLTLKIDQKKYFAFQIDMTDRMFIPQDLQAKAVDRGTHRVKNTIDAYLAGLYGDAGITTDLGNNTTAIDITSGNVVTYLGKIARYMTAGDVPEEGRWCVIPAWMDEKLWTASVTDLTNNNEAYAQGYRGNIRGLNIYVSNNVQAHGGTAGTYDKVLAGVPGTMALAIALNGDPRFKEAEKRRAINVDGLFIYGGKIVRPDTLACLTCDDA
jgi:hypothetical protein